MANALLFRDEDDGIWYGDILRILDIDEQYGGQSVERIPNVYPPRVDPADILTDDVFKSHFRIDKLTALRLADVLGLHAPENNRGSPLNAQQLLCICLNHFAGGPYQRVTALCGGQVSKSSAQRQIKRVRSKLLELKDNYVRLPTLQEREETAEYILEKYNLPGFAYGIDGMHAVYEELPCGIPIGPGYPVAQSFWTRKGHPAVPVLTLGNHRKLILALDKDWNGGAHDAVIWEHCLFKPSIEENRAHLLAGDSAFPISDVLIKPYTVEVSFIQSDGTETFRFESGQKKDEFEERREKQI